eukprot:PITA_09362
MLYDKIPDAPRPEFFVPPPPKSNKDSHTGNGVIGTTSTKTINATSKKAHTISSQNANEKLLTSEVNAMSTDKGKEPNKLGASTEVVPPIIPELMIKLPKGVVNKSTFNPHARVAHNYNIVEDLAQSMSAMSTLELLQNCPSQKQAMLSAIGRIDPVDSNLVAFNHKGYDPQLPTQLSFLVQVKALNKTIHRTIIYEGESTCIMLMSCWKTFGSPPLSQSSTTLKAFDGRTYTPYGILSNLQVKMGGKTIEIDVEVINGNLDYNILLGRHWIYAMGAVVLTYFRKIVFPFQ